MTNTPKKDAIDPTTGKLYRSNPRYFRVKPELTIINEESGTSVTSDGSGILTWENFNDLYETIDFQIRGIERDCNGDIEIRIDKPGFESLCKHFGILPSWAHKYTD